MHDTTMPSVTPGPDVPLPDGRRLGVFTLRNGRGMELEAITLGGAVTRLLVPDAAGRRADVTLGCASLPEYADDPFALGAVVGRCANRIAGGRLHLDGRDFPLPLNNHPAGRACHLHGGPGGFHRRDWNGAPVLRPGAAGVRFSRRSPDGEEGYPGNLDVSVTYWLTTRDEWVVEYAAATDRRTVVNLTHHAFFNLSGADGGDILGHELCIRASCFTPVDAGLIPTGERRAVAGTPFDFTAPRRVGERIGSDDEQLRHGCGYDHNWILDRSDEGLIPAARLRDPVSGRVLEILTTEPGLQFYSGNFLDGSRPGRPGRPLAHRSGLCLETQHFPDAPHHPDFPSIVLDPGHIRRSVTVHRFGTTEPG